MNKNYFLKFFLPVGDVVLMYGALFLVLAFRYGDFSLFPGPQSREFFFHFAVIHAAWLVLLFALDFYEIFSIKKFAIFFKNLVIFCVLALAFGALYFYLNLNSVITPKTILLFDILLFAFFAALWRGLFVLVLRGKFFQKRIAVAGWCPQMDDLAKNYLGKMNYEISAIFNPGSLAGFEKLKIFNRAENFVNFVKSEKIDTAIFAAPQNSGGAFSDIPHGVKIVNLENFYEEITGKISLDLIDESWLLENISKSGGAADRIAKRMFDVVLSIIGLAITAVIFPFVFLAIKLDSRGPVFYIQERKGKNGKIFSLYKFRTMIANGKQHTVWRANADDQITGAGKILRKTHIDEFPQFFNIFKGDVSFVGPRPEWEKIASNYEKEIPFYKYRYLVHPGFTGWAQINYNASSSVDEAREKFEYDLYYIKNRSFVLDIAILLKTIQLFFR